jgi:hypothetical protein
MKPDAPVYSPPPEDSLVVEDQGFLDHLGVQRQLPLMRRNLGRG